MKPHSRPQLAIVGAGVSGLGAAWALGDSDWEVTVFEKSRGVSGRAASRSGRSARYDTGANYFKLDTKELEELVLRTLPTEGLVQVAGDVCPFDASGKISPGDPDQNAVPKWTYRDGISTLGKRLAEAAGIKVRRETQVVEVTRDGGGWALSADDGAQLGPFDALLLTPPAPQTAALLRASRDDEFLGCVELLEDVDYHRQFALVFGYSRKVRRPLDAYALINSDRRHDIAWLGFEDAKPGRVADDGGSVLVAQMSPGWTAAHYDDSDDELRAAAAPLVGSLLGSPGLPPSWFDKQRWRYAHPQVALDIDELEEEAPEGLFFAGDAFVGKGKVGAALETGLRAAERVLEL